MANEGYPGCTVDIDEGKLGVKPHSAGRQARRGMCGYDELAMLCPCSGGIDCRGALLATVVGKAIIGHVST